MKWVFRLPHDHKLTESGLKSFIEVLSKISDEHRTEITGAYISSFEREFVIEIGREKE